MNEDSDEMARSGLSLGIATSVLETVDELVIIIDNNENILYMNYKACKSLGCEQADVVSKNFFDEFVKEEDCYDLTIRFKRLVEGKCDEISLECTLSFDEHEVLIVGNIKSHTTKNDSRVFILTGVSVPEGSAGAAELVRSRHMLSVLNMISRIFLTESDEEMYSDVLKLVLKEVGSKYGYFGFIDQNGDLVASSMTRDVWDKCQIPDKSVVFPRESWSGIWGISLEKKRTVVKNEENNVPDGHIPLHRSLCVPILHKDKLIGQIAVANKEDDYDSNDIRLLEEIANYIAPVLDAKISRAIEAEQKEKTQRELIISTHKLNERVKELECICEASVVLTPSDRPFSEVFRELLLVIRKSLQFPEVACARIILDCEIYKTENCQETPWKISAPITVEGIEKGVIEFGYLEERPDFEEGPFLREERELIDALAREIGYYVNLKQARDNLVESEQKYRALFDSATDAILIHDYDLHFIEVNRVACERLEYSQEELLSMRVPDLDSEDFVPEIVPKFETLLSEGEIVFETAHKTKSGKVIPVEIRSRLVSFKGKDAVLSTARDISVRKEAEERARRKRELLDAINSVFQDALVCESIVEVAKTGITVAEELTNSEFGFIGELNEAGLMDTIALSISSWENCETGIDEKSPRLQNMALHSFWGIVFHEKEPVIINNPNSHPARIGTPKGHPAIESFLGVPLWRGDDVSGIVAVANRPGGYTEEEAAVLENLAVAFSEALDRKRAEIERNESEKRYRSLLESMTDGAFVLNKEWKYTVMNEAAAKLAKQPKEHLLGKTIMECFPGIEESPFFKTYSRVMKKRVPETVTESYRYDDDTVGWFEANVYPVPGGILVIMHDVTSEHEAARKVKQSEERLRFMIENLPVLVDAIDEDNNIIMWNKECERVTGYTADELIGKPEAWKMLYPDDIYRESLFEYLSKSTGDFWNYETEITCKDGSKRVIAWTNISRTQKIPGWTEWAVGVDVTERVRATKELRETLQALEESNQSLEERSEDLLLLYQLSRNLSSTMDFDTLLSITHQQLSQNLPHDVSASLLITDKDQDIVVQPIRPLDESVESEIIEGLVKGYDSTKKRTDRQIREYVHIKQDIRDPVIPEGTKIHKIGSFVQSPLIVGQDKQTVGILFLGAEGDDVFSEDHVRLVYTIANQVAASLEKILSRFEEEQARLRNLFEHLPEGVILLDSEMRVIFANRAASEYLTELSDAEMGSVLTSLGGRPINELLEKPSDSTRHEIQLERESKRVFELELTKIVSGPQKGGWAIVLDDVTREREIQIRAQTQDRLAAIGQLAAGMAHDFSNILQGIMGFAQILELRGDIPKDALGDLKAIQDLGNKGSQLTRQVLDFSRQSISDKKPVNVRNIVFEILDLLRGTIPESIKIEVQAEPGSYFILGDETQLQQLLMNLAINSRDAMPSGGRLIFRLSEATLDDIAPTEKEDLMTHDFVCLEVIDSGSGMSQEVLAKIFEPFFTTKDRTKGAGLGLAQVYGIVKQHKGEISVESKIGEGTTFRILLPKTDDVGLAEPRVKARQADYEGCTILLVEDEEMVLSALSRILQKLGCNTITARDGKEALSIFRKERKNISIVITDMVMPNMDGNQLITELRKIDSDVRVVLMTGYPLGTRVDKLPDIGFSAWIQKPIRLEQLQNLLSSQLSDEATL